jgi:hypothetical protein
MLGSCVSTVPPSHDTAEDAGAPTTSGTPQLLELGQVAELDQYRIKLVSQRDCETRPVARGRSGFRTWAVELEITNKSSRRIPVNPFCAKLVDGEKFSYTTTLTGCEPLLPARLLAPHETVRGFIPFQLPNTTPNVVLSYRPVTAGSRQQEARYRVEL